MNRCGDEASLRADELTTQLRDELARVFAHWGLVLAALDVETLELVTADPDASDRVRVRGPA